MSRYSTIIIFCHRKYIIRNMFRSCLVLKWTAIFDLTYWHIRSRWRFVYLKILIFFHSRTLFITNWRRLLHYQLFIKGMISEKNVAILCVGDMPLFMNTALFRNPQWMRDGDGGWSGGRHQANILWPFVCWRFNTFSIEENSSDPNVSNPSVLIAFHMTDSINSPFISKASAIIPIQSHTDNNSMYMFHSIVPQSPG